MLNVHAKKSELAYFLGPNQTKNLVLCRAYGDIVSIIFDDTLIDETAVLRVNAKHFGEFLEPLSDGLIVKDMDDQYNALDTYLTVMNQPVLGPLTSARAVLFMKADQCSPSSAIQKALDQGAMLIREQTERLGRIDAA